MKYLYQFIPNKFEYLNNTKTIIFKDVKLKTSYIINIIHEIILKYYFSNNNYIDFGPNEDITFNLWSMILRKNYGMHYNLYIDYLIETGFISMVSNYYSGKKARTYKMNNDDIDINSIKKIKITDNILIKKNSKEYLMRSMAEYNNSPIDISIRKRLIEDLYYVKINHDESLNYLNDLKNRGNIELNKFYKNLNSIDSIKNRNLFFKFDEFGRFHTNFTILKKEIRQKWLTIDNDDIMEIDISNSQPLFLGILLMEHLDINDDEIKKYLGLIKNGLFYEYIISHFNNLTRKDVKLLTFKVLFGLNGVNSIENKIFSSLFPKIYDFIIDYKKNNNNYKSLSYKLQRMESDFIFGKVIKTLYEKNPHIKIITIHDSLLFSIKYEKMVKEVFDKYTKELFQPFDEKC